MTAWTNDELTKIGAAEELAISPLGRDGSLHNPVTIWVVRVGDDLFVRSVRGQTSGWFQGAQVRHEGQIEAGGVQKYVNFENVAENSDLEAQIDAAYHRKYRRYAGSIVNSTLTPQARATSLKLVPRS